MGNVEKSKPSEIDDAKENDSDHVANNKGELLMFLSNCIRSLFLSCLFLSLAFF